MEVVDKVILNSADINSENGTDCSYSVKETREFITTFRKTLLGIVSQFLSETDGSVDYNGLNSSSNFSNFKIDSRSLSKCRIDLLTHDERKAAFLNLYNVLTIHALSNQQQVLNASVHSPLDIDNFWSRFCYKIGKYVYSLDDIEHGLLRGNHIHPTSGIQSFLQGDPRIEYTFVIDPRVHFALNCGAKSCPIVRIYKPESLDDQLDRVTRGYLQQEVKIEKNSIVLPQIFEWYMKDFGDNLNDVLRWMLRYIEGKNAQILSSMAECSAEELSSRVNYFYDWNINKR